MNYFKTSMVITICLLITACGNSTSSSGNGAPANSSPVAANSGPILTSDQMAGNWLGACGLSYSSTGSSYEQYRLAFSGVNSVSFSVSGYSTSGCAGAPVVTVVLTGTFALPQLDSVVNGATDMDFTVTQASMTPGTVAAATAMNASVACGLSTWQNGVTQSLPLTNACISATLPVNEIAEVSGTNLYFGNSDDSAINMNSSYVRQ